MVEPLPSGPRNAATPGRRVAPLADRIDGRTARAQRTRSAIVQAHMALLADGDSSPTGERIAARAEVSLRALWMHFADMESLFAATGAAVLAHVDSHFRPVSPQLPLPSRIDRFCRQRARQLEMVAPYARAAQAREASSPQLQAYRARHVARVRSEVEELFAAELADRGADREDAVLAITVASTWGAWSVLRDHLRLSVPRARRVMHRSLAALLDGAPAAGGDPG